jgi:hypothetical protein
VRPVNHVEDPGVIQKTKATTGSKPERVLYKSLTWLAFAVGAGLLPLFKGTHEAYYEAIEGGELYLIGAVVVLAALGDLLYSTLPLSKPKRLKVGDTDIYSPLFLISTIICLALALINMVAAGHMPEINYAALNSGHHRSYVGYYVVYITTAIASIGTVILGVTADE